MQCAHEWTVTPEKPIRCSVCGESKAAIEKGDTPAVRVIGIVDLETTGTDPASGHVVEVAMALYSVADRGLIRARSWLCSAPAEEVKKTHGIHGISPSLVAARGVPFEDAARQVHAVAVKEVQALCAWNASFDRAWFPPTVQEVKPWLCLMNDFDWPKASSGKSLLAVAHAHGLQIGALHRAMDDVQLCCRLLDRCAETEDLTSKFVDAMLPKFRYVANVPREENSTLKRHSFRWDPERREWWRNLTAAKAATLPFPVSQGAATTHDR